MERTETLNITRSCGEDCETPNQFDSYSPSYSNIFYKRGEEKAHKNALSTSLNELFDGKFLLHPNPKKKKKKTASPFSLTVFF